MNPARGLLPTRSYGVCCMGGMRGARGARAAVLPRICAVAVAGCAASGTPSLRGRMLVDEWRVLTRDPADLRAEASLCPQLDAGRWMRDVYIHLHLPVSV